MMYLYIFLSTISATFLGCVIYARVSYFLFMRKMKKTKMPYTQTIEDAINIMGVYTNPRSLPKIDPREPKAKA